MEVIIQVLILACLIVIMVLLSVDKVTISSQRKDSNDVTPKPEPDIVGKAVMPVKERGLSWVADRKKIERMAPHRTGEVDNDQQEEKLSDPIVEEFDDEDNIPPYDDRFDQAVSLDELSKVGNLLQWDSLDIHDEKIAAGIIQKMEGTEFFTMMQESIEGASQKIARLLDKSLSEEQNTMSKQNENNEIDSFNIGDFI